MQKRILIVEDNEQNLYLATFLLEQKGYKVIAAQNGLEAIDKTLTEKPDLILMDIQLPEVNGYEATKRIKSMSEIHHIPIVALTSYPLCQNRCRLKVMGF
jgi:two-component system cell cycle response regulator DivK